MDVLLYDIVYLMSQGEGGDTQEELEKLQKEGKKHIHLLFATKWQAPFLIVGLSMDTEKARLLAEGNAAMEARRAEAEAESKRKRDLEREKARQALQEASE